MERVGIDMKKYIVVIFILVTSLILIGCRNKIELLDNYNEETFGYIDINSDEVKILQLTDLHLTYGFDYLDRQTYHLITNLINSENPDIIIVTGDLFMSIIGISLLENFINFMEEFKTPWTFIFGNHEIDFNHNVESIVSAIYSIDTKYLYFHHGPKLSNDHSHGYSNFKLKITNNNQPILNLYLFDSKANRKDGVKDKNFPYDYLSEEQVNWYETSVSSDLVESLIFVHIPLMEFLEYDGPKGEQIWPQGKNTNLFSKIVDSGKSRAVFVGHDHLNNFSFYYQDILLAYGNVTGFNAYGTNEKGARVITYNYQTQELGSYLVLEGDLNE